MAEIQNITEKDIKDKISSFIIEKFLLGDNSRVLNPEDSFLEKGIIDSTGILELVSFIEEAFSVKVEDEELIPDNLDSLNNIGIFVASKIKN